MTSILRELIIENKKDDARRMITPMIIQGTFSQQEIEDRMMQRLKIKPTTADTYYHMIVKELKLANRSTNEKSKEADTTAASKDGREEPEAELLPDIEFDDDGVLVRGIDELDDDQLAVKNDINKRGVIRRIKNAHLIYKRQNSTGSFDELWIFNSSSNMTDALDIQRDILAATDIGPRQTTSEDGSQKYKLSTVGDVQYLEITGLPQ